jgi:hypothetical protein
MLKDSIVEGSESLHTCQETFGKHRSMGSFSTVIHPEGFASKALALNGTLFDKRRACGSVYLSVSFGVLPGHNPYDNTSKFQNMSKPMQIDANIANESTTDKSPQLVSQEESVPSRAAAVKGEGVLEASRETKTDEEDKADKWQEEEAAAAMKRAHEGETARRRAEEAAAKRAEEQEAAQKTSDFNILKVSPGSVVVDMNAPERAAQEIHRHSLDPNSRLRSGTFHRFTDEISLPMAMQQRGEEMNGAAAAAAMKGAQEEEETRKRAERLLQLQQEEAAEEAVVAAKKNAEEEREARRAAEALAELARAEKAGAVGGGGDIWLSDSFCMFVFVYV